MEALVEGMPLIVSMRRSEADQNVKTAKSGGLFTRSMGMRSRRALAAIFRINISV
jgi:hypothetical protein